MIHRLNLTVYMSEKKPKSAKSLDLRACVVSEESRSRSRLDNMLIDSIWIDSIADNLSCSNLQRNAYDSQAMSTTYLGLCENDSTWSVLDKPTTFHNAHSSTFYLSVRRQQTIASFLDPTSHASGEQHSSTMQSMRPRSRSSVILLRKCTDTDLRIIWLDVVCKDLADADSNYITLFLNSFDIIHSSVDHNCATCYTK